LSPDRSEACNRLFPARGRQRACESSFGSRFVDLVVLTPFGDENGDDESVLVLMVDRGTSGRWSTGPADHLVRVRRAVVGRADHHDRAVGDQQDQPGARLTYAYRRGDVVGTPPDRYAG